MLCEVGVDAEINYVPCESCTESWVREWATPLRSRVMLEELVKRHEIQVVVSGRAYDYLSAWKASALPADRVDVQKIWGYS